MLGTLDYLGKAMESVRDIVQQTNAIEKAREGKQKGLYDDDDGSVYGDGMKQHYGSLGEVKKRRGVSNS